MNNDMLLWKQYTSLKVFQNGQILTTDLDSLSGLVLGAEKLLNFSLENHDILDTYGRIVKGNNIELHKLNDTILENNADRFLELLLRITPFLATVKKPWHDKLLVCVSHDVDGPFLKNTFSLMRSLFYALRGNKAEGESFVLGMFAKLFSSSDPYEMFGEWLNVGAEWGSQTFFFYPGRLQSARRHNNDPHYCFDRKIQKHVQELSKCRQEVGLHTGIYGHSKDALIEAKEKIEHFTQRPLEGARSHYWSGVWKDPLEQWKNLHECGFCYDTSLNPLGLGFRSGISLPLMPSFRYSDNIENSFVVLPTPIMDTYAVDSLIQNDGLLFSTVALCKKSGLCILDWHERVLSNVGPWKNYPLVLFQTLDELAHDTDLFFLSINKIAQQWKNHVNNCYVSNQK